MRIFLISAVAIPLAGCALPPALAIASYAGDAVLMVASDKTSTDHLLSMAEKKDCAMWRVIKGQPICHEWKDGKDPYEKYRDPDGNQVATAGSDAGFTTGMAKDSRQDVDDQLAAAHNNGAKPKDGVLLAQAGTDRPVTSAADARRAAGMVQSAPLAPPPGTPGAATGPAPQTATPAIAPAASAADTVNDGAPVTQPIPPAAIAADSKPTIAAPAPPAAPVVATSNPADAPTAAGKPTKAAAKPAVKPATPAKAAASGAADRYVVLGSFRQHDNAQRLQRDHGDIKPVVQSVTVKNKHYYRVVAGPYTASRAADIRDDLKEKAHIDAIVARDCDAKSKHRCVEIDG